MNEHDRRLADRTARAARESIDRGKVAAEGAARSAEQSYLAAADGIRDFNARLIEMAHANTLAAVDFAREISTAKDPSAAAALWSSHLRQNLETLTDQSRELATLAQRIATSSAEPLTRGFGTAFKGTT